MRYAADRMYDVASFSGLGDSFLFGQAPRVQRPQGVPTTLDLGIRSVAIPLDARTQHKDGRPSLPVRLYNPSVARAPTGLCGRCAFVVAARVDALHQCDASGPLLSGRRARAQNYFQGTAIALLDAELRVLGWTWLINSPSFQLAPDSAAARRAGCVPLGSADGNLSGAVPWSKQTYDSRLLHVDGRILITYMCHSCKFSVSQLHLTASRTDGGGLVGLRAWCDVRHTWLDGVAWLDGRNQALFVFRPPRVGRGRGRAGEQRPAQLMVQSRLGLSGRLGAIEWRTRRPFACPATRASWRLPPQLHNCQADPLLAKCGPHPPGARLTLEKMATRADAFLELNETKRIARRLRAAGHYGGLSLTSNLVLAPAAAPDGSRCDVYLGVAHLHRGEGAVNRHRYGRKPQAGRLGPRAKQPFAFGYRYTHFWYALSVTPPFHTVAASAEFCLESPQTAADCESIQFVSGLELVEPGPAGRRAADNRTLLVSYGVNDCEGRLGRLPLQQVLSALRPLRPRSDAAPAGEACSWDWERRRSTRSRPGGGGSRFSHHNTSN